MVAPLVLIDLLYAYFFQSLFTDIYSFVLLNNSFSQIDLSSLEEISNGGVVWNQNVNLCYVGNFSLYVDTDMLNNTGQFAVECPNSTFTRRKANDECSELKNNTV